MEAARLLAPEVGQAQDLFLQAEGKLAAEAPVASGGAEFDEYVSDPATRSRSSKIVNVGMTREYMTDDQRFASRRPDVLVYQTEPLEADLTMAGPIVPDLKVSTSGTDSDWVVKVIDVYPDDYPDDDALSYGPSELGSRWAATSNSSEGK